MMTQKLGFIGFVLLLLAACTPIPPRDPEFAPVKPASLMPPIQNSGSIYQSGYDMRLFEDNKAMRVGDVLTIKLEELTQAKKADDLNAKKDLDVLVSAPTIGGIAMSSLTGNEYIRLSGIVRPVDISPDNTISSDKVADATIMYIGDGAMADASKMVWLSRIIYSPWFPF